MGAWRTWSAAAAAVVLAVVILAGCATDLSRAELADEYVALGSGYLRLDQPERAIAYLERALELRPDAPGARFHLATALIRAGHPAAAMPHLDLLAAATPDNVRVLELRAAALQGQGRFAAALAVYRKLLHLQPAHVTARYNAAMLLWEQGDRAAAADELRVLLDQEPGDHQARYQLGVLLADSGLPDAAAPVLSRYLEVHPDDLDALVALARVETRRESYVAALRAYELALVALGARGGGSSGSPERRDLYAEVEFERAVILLTEVEAPYAGLKALRTALQNGFADPQRLAALLAEPDLLVPERVRAFLDAQRP